MAATIISFRPNKELDDQIHEYVALENLARSEEEKLSPGLVAKAATAEHVAFHLRRLRHSIKQQV